MSRFAKYNNGNYVCMIDLDNGTKIRYSDEDNLVAELPESMDIKITNCCDGIGGKVCKWCHEKSTPNGRHGDIMNAKFIDTLHPYTELALGGGNVLLHPDFILFLEKCAKLKLIPSVTVNQYHFMEHRELLKELCDKKLIYGLGISLNHVDEDDNDFINAVKDFPNAVIHVINGIVTTEQLYFLSHMGLKILILGYKEFGRGVEYYNGNQLSIECNKTDLYNMLQEIIEDGWFDVVSFDNLAIKQLEVKRLMSDEEWNRFYMGNDGLATMYIDLVEQKFAKSSTSIARYDLKDDIKDIFNIIHNEG